MSTSELLHALAGGSLIGLAVTMMLLFNGRVTGVSGIVYSALAQFSRDNRWRWLFIVGMICGGFITYTAEPALFHNSSDRGIVAILVAGFLVGFGTVMGAGCTSGHGICGISRLSVRSILATGTFMLIGLLSVQLMKWLVSV